MSRLSSLARRRPRLTALLLLTLTMTFWAVNAIVARAAAVGDLIPPFSLTFWRWVIAFLVLLPLGLRSVIAQRALYFAHWRRLLLLGLFGVSTFNTCQYVALDYTTATNFGVFNSAMPFAIFLLTWAVGQERATVRQHVGLLVALGGVLTVITRGDLEVLLALAFNFGDLLLLFALFMWAVYSVLLRGMPNGLDPFGLLTVLVFIGLFGIAPFYVSDLLSGRYFAVDPTNVSILLFVGTLPSVAAYMCWIVAIKLAGANLAGASANMLPLMTAALAIVVLGETFAVYHAAGLGLIFAGLFLSARR